MSSASSHARPVSESFAQVVAGQHQHADRAAYSATPTSPGKRLDASAAPFNPSGGYNGASAVGLTDARPSQRPVSEIIPAPSATAASATPAEADAIDRWADDLAQYEETIEAMARASLDQNFKDELSAIEQWFQVLSDAERTATLYSLLQHTSRVQQGFFIAFLQQLARKENRGLAGDRAAREAKKAAEVGRARRMSQNKPQLAGISDTNEKYAKMFGEDVPMAAVSAARASQVTAYANRPRSAATSSGAFPDPRTLVGASQIMAAAGMRPRSVMDPTAFEDASSVRAPPGLDGPPRGSKWSPLTPTFSNFSEIARGIERPQSTNDLDRSGAFGAQAALAARGPSKLGGSSHTVASIMSAAGISANTVRSPMGPSLDASSGFAARAARASFGNTARTMGQTPPLSASMRSVASPAFPPGLFPSNPWAAAASVASPSMNSAIMHGMNSAGLSSRGLNGTPSSSTINGQPTTPGGPQSLKQKFASLIVENRIDTAKEVTARLSGVPLTPTSGVAEKIPKPVDPIDFRLLNDISAWFRAMRLHKYTSLFEGKRWQDISKLSDEELTAIGVSALGARRKLLKVFEQIREEAPAKGIALN